MPQGKDFDRAVEKWSNYASDADAEYDDVVTFDATEIQPTVTWGVTPAQAISITEKVPSPEDAKGLEKSLGKDALG